MKTEILVPYSGTIQSPFNQLIWVFIFYPNIFHSYQIYLQTLLDCWVVSFHFHFCSLHILYCVYTICRLGQIIELHLGTQQDFSQMLLVGGLWTIYLSNVFFMVDFACLFVNGFSLSGSHLCFAKYCFIWLLGCSTCLCQCSMRQYSKEDKLMRTHH